MEVIRCARCGAFYTNGGNVCSNCIEKDNYELSKFKNFMEDNIGNNIQSLSQVSLQTGISEKVLNNFLDYDGFQDYKKLLK